MKNKTSITHLTRLCLCALLAGVLFISCKDQPSFVEQIGKDFREVQSEFEKGYKQQDTSWISIDTIIIDTTIIRAMEKGKYPFYRIKFIGKNVSGLKITYFINDSVSALNAR